MKKGVKAALYLSAVCIAAGGIMTGIGALAGGYDQLDQVNSRFRYSSGGGWNLPWAYSMYSLPGLGTLLSAMERGESRIEIQADAFEDSVERAADRFEASMEQAADQFEASAERAAESLDGSVGNGSGSLLDTWKGEEPESGQEVYSGDFETDISYTGTLRSLEVEIGVHSLEIKEGSGEGIHAEGTNCDQIQVYVKNGTLCVKDVGRKKVNSVGTSGRRIVLTVPAGLRWKEAELDADMGSVIMDSLCAVSAELDADMGSIEIGTADADEMDLDVDMGSIEVKNARIGELEADADMGGIRVEGIVEGNVEAKADMGSIEMVLRQEQADFNYRISASMGNVSVGGEEYSGLDKKLTVNNSAGKWMELDSSMGSIEISFK